MTTKELLDLCESCEKIGRLKLYNEIVHKCNMDGKFDVYDYIKEIYDAKHD